ncbi:hypothetical protein ILUMI_19543, partial [Ignelater luminosus]
ALTVACAIYFSKWYSHHFPSLKVPLLLIMQNAQHEITIRAGGLVAINTETFVNVSLRVEGDGKIAKKMPTKKEKTARSSSSRKDGTISSKVRKKIQNKPHMCTENIKEERSCHQKRIAAPNHTLQNQLRHAFVFAVLTTQLSLYCVPANYITDK